MMLRKFADASDPLPKNVHKIAARGREYFYLQVNRGMPHQSPRVRLTNPFDPAEMARAYGLVSEQGGCDWKSQIHYCYVSAKKRAKDKSRTFSVDERYLLTLLNKQEHRCAVSGILFEGDGYSECHMKPFGISLDRIDPAYGYTKDNVRLVCKIANFAMGQWGLPALERLAVAVSSRVRKRTPAELEL